MHIPSFRTRLPLVADLNACESASFQWLATHVLEALGNPTRIRILEDSDLARPLYRHVNNAWGLASPLTEPFPLSDGNGKPVATLRFHAPTVQPDEPEGALPFLAVDELGPEKNAEIVQRFFDTRIGALYFLDHNGNRAVDTAVRALAPDDSDRERLLVFLRRHWCSGFQSQALSRDRGIQLKNGRRVVGYPPIQRTYPADPERLLTVWDAKDRYDRIATEAVLRAVFTLFKAQEEFDRGPGGLPRH